MIGLLILALLFKRNQNADTQECVLTLPMRGEMCMGKYSNKPCSSVGEGFPSTTKCSLVVNGQIWSLC